MIAGRSNPGVAPRRGPEESGRGVARHPDRGARGRRLRRRGTCSPAASPAQRARAPGRASSTYRGDAYEAAKQELESKDMRVVRDRATRERRRHQHGPDQNPREARRSTEARRWSSPSGSSPTDRVCRTSSGMTVADAIGALTDAASAGSPDTGNQRGRIEGTHHRSDPASDTRCARHGGQRFVSTGPGLVTVPDVSTAACRSARPARR